MFPSTTTFSFLSATVSACVVDGFIPVKRCCCDNEDINTFPDIVVAYFGANNDVFPNAELVFANAFEASCSDGVFDAESCSDVDGTVGLFDGFNGAFPSVEFNRNELRSSGFSVALFGELDANDAPKLIVEINGDDTAAVGDVRGGDDDGRTADEAAVAAPAAVDDAKLKIWIREGCACGSTLDLDDFTSSSSSSENTTTRRFLFVGFPFSVSSSSSFTSSSAFSSLRFSRVNPPPSVSCSPSLFFSFESKITNTRFPPASDFTTAFKPAPFFLAFT
mmetsp:Transcript_7689/g.13953  ORF Transcript_7689/g.13953 Transcript_7689/m.13953 type:complete len:277 (-) Transcript_7689:135-965(-)